MTKAGKSILRGARQALAYALAANKRTRAMTIDEVIGAMLKAFGLEFTQTHDREGAMRAALRAAAKEGWRLIEVRPDQAFCVFDVSPETLRAVEDLARMPGSVTVIPGKEGGADA